MSRNRPEMRHSPGDLRGCVKEPREHRKAGHTIPRPCEKELATPRQMSSVSLTPSQMRPERSGVGQTFHRALPLNCFKENSRKQTNDGCVHPTLHSSKQTSREQAEPILGKQFQAASRPWKEREVGSASFQQKHGTHVHHANTATCKPEAKLIGPGPEFSRLLWPLALAAISCGSIRPVTAMWTQST